MDFAINSLEEERALMSPGDFMTYAGYAAAVAGVVAMFC